MKFKEYMNKDELSEARINKVLTVVQKITNVHNMLADIEDDDGYPDTINHGDAVILLDWLTGYLTGKLKEHPSSIIKNQYIDKIQKVSQ